MAIKAARDGPGVTPGLRRRRERAERQKTFIREQQEAAAAGLRVFDAKEDPDIHGKREIVGVIATAVELWFD